MAIQRSKYTGDPGWGWLGDIAKKAVGVVGSFVPGPIGIAARLAKKRLFPPAPGTTTFAQGPVGTGIPRQPTGMPGVGAVTVEQYRQQCSAEGVPDWYACGNERFGRGDPYTEVMNGVGGAPAQTMAAMQAGKPCAVSGYHWNKSGYFLKSGQYVDAGTKMVKNRRRNPANPRATSNAITRIKGAKRYAASLSSISIRKKC